MVTSTAKTEATSTTVVSWTRTIFVADRPYNDLYKYTQVFTSRTS